MTNVAKLMIKRECKNLSQVIIIWSLESYPQSWKARSSHHDENDSFSIRKGSSSKASFFLSIKDKSSNINDIFHRLLRRMLKYIVWSSISTPLLVSMITYDLHRGRSSPWVWKKFKPGRKNFWRVRGLQRD